MTRRLTALLLAGLLLAGCGGGSDPMASEPSANGRTEPSGDSREKGLKGAVEAYSVAYLSGDGSAAYGLLSSRCKDRTTLSEFAALTEAAESTYGPMPIESIDVNLNGDQAQATYTYADPSINQDSEPWVFQGGWRNDDC